MFIFRYFQMATQMFNAGPEFCRGRFVCIRLGYELAALFCHNLPIGAFSLTQVVLNINFFRVRKLFNPNQWALEMY